MTGTLVRIFLPSEWTTQRYIEVNDELKRAAVEVV